MRCYALSLLLVVTTSACTAAPAHGSAVPPEAATLRMFSGATVQAGVLDVPDFGVSLQLPAACHPADTALPSTDLSDVPGLEVWRLPCPPDGPDSPGPEVTLVLSRETSIPAAGEAGLEAVRVHDANPSWPDGTIVDAQYRYADWAPGVWHRALEREHRGWFFSVLVVHDASTQSQVDALVDSLSIR